jgi:hypothetical protein
MSTNPKLKQTKETKETKKQEEINFAELYVAQMSEKEKKAYEIAKSHLGCSFHLEKSDGFLNFIKSEQSDAGS